MATRRQFLKGLLAGLALAAINPAEVLASPGGQPVLVAVHLTGGNDALNTLIPHKSAAYLKARPNLALPSKNLLTTERGLALHPSLSQTHSRFTQGNVLFVPGIGRDDHDRSHFRSSDIWHGAGNPGGDGWMAQLGKRLESTPVSLGPSVSRAVACPDHPPIGLVGQRPGKFPGPEAVQRAWFDMYKNWQAPHPVAQRLKRSAAVVDDLTTRLEGKMGKAPIRQAFSGDDFGKRFELAYRLIASGFPARLLHISVGKFDTHSGQLSDHAQQLAQFDHAAWAFLENMKALGQSSTLMVYSEFGRRVSENFSGGTDHGAGGLAWLMGDSVKGGVTGEYQLEDLRDGDLPTKVPYQGLYAQAVTSAFGAAHSEALFGDVGLVSV
jgi:uncharacterized protein (DUF1501 family)